MVFDDPCLKRRGRAQRFALSVVAFGFMPLRDVFRLYEGADDIAERTFARLGVGCA